MEKTVVKPRLIRWLLLLHKFDFKVKDQIRTENKVVGHLSWLDKEAMLKLKDEIEIYYTFLDDQVLAISQGSIP